MSKITEHVGRPVYNDDGDRVGMVRVDIEVEATSHHTDALALEVNHAIREAVYEALEEHDGHP